MKARISILMFFLAASPFSSAQVLTEWVEWNPANDPTKIELGYPTPIPVDTPMPFDGFRTYAGLHARHQDLAATTPYVHGVVIGQTGEGRTIWAYRLGDEDLETIDGSPEPATLTNGGIHGTVIKVAENVVQLRVMEGKLEISRSAVADIQTAAE